MYFRLKNVEYQVTSCNVGFDLVSHNQTLLMFIDIEASTDNEAVDPELRSIHLYHNNGFRTGVRDTKRLKRKKFVWRKSVNWKQEEAGTMYVLEHEDIASGTIHILDVTGDRIQMKWTGLANIGWNDEFGEKVPFAAEVEAELPPVPKEKVLNGLKKTKLKIDKNTELELLNFPDIIKEAKRCQELWHKNDRKAWSKYNAVLNLKLTYEGKVYYGQAIYAGSTRESKVVFDDSCPLAVSFPRTVWASDKRYEFYVVVEKK